MHERSHFHGDLKMENLMISKKQETGEYSLRVGDFGLMKVCQGGAGTSDSDEDTVHVLRARSSGVVSRPERRSCHAPPLNCCCAFFFLSPLRQATACLQSQQFCRTLLVQLPPELLKVVPCSRGGQTLIRDPGIRTVDPAAADVWAAGHVLLWLVGIRALQASLLRTVSHSSAPLRHTPMSE